MRQEIKNVCNDSKNIPRVGLNYINQDQLIFLKIIKYNTKIKKKLNKAKTIWQKKTTKQKEKKQKQQTIMNTKNEIKKATKNTKNMKINRLDNKMKSIQLSKIFTIIHPANLSNSKK